MAGGAAGLATDATTFVTAAPVAVTTRAAGTATLATGDDATGAGLATGGTTGITVGANSMGPAACNVGTTMLGNGREFTTDGGTGVCGAVATAWRAACWGIALGAWTCGALAAAACDAAAARSRNFFPGASPAQAPG